MGGKPFGFLSFIKSELGSVESSRFRAQVLKSALYFYTKHILLISGEFSEGRRVNLQSLLNRDLNERIRVLSGKFSKSMYTLPCSTNIPKQA